MSRLRDLGTREPLPLRLVFWDGDTFDFAPEANSAEATLAAGIERYRVWRIYLAAWPLPSIAAGSLSLRFWATSRPPGGRPIARGAALTNTGRTSRRRLSAPLDWLAP